MKRLFHIDGTPVPKRAKMRSLPAPVALFHILECGAGVETVGLFSAVYKIDGKQGFAVKRLEVRKEVGISKFFNTLTKAHADHRLVAYHIPVSNKGTQSLSVCEKFRLRLEQKALNPDNTDWSPRVVVNRNAGLNIAPEC